jgi:hypothetical protein
VLHALARIAFDSPTCEIRNENVVAEVQLGLIEDQPAAGAVDAELKRTGNQCAKRRGRADVTENRVWRGVELAAEDLGDEVLGHGAQVCVGRAFLERLHHAPEAIMGISGRIKRQSSEYRE